MKPHPTAATADGTVAALALALQVLLPGSGLPKCWAGRSHFVILDTHFGLGHSFLATWDAWRHDPQRCERLHFVALAPKPPSRTDLALAHGASPWPELVAELLQAWPPLAPKLHALDFDDGRVRLLLALGGLATLLPTLRLSADLVLLGHGQATPRGCPWQPRALKAVGRLAAPGARLASTDLAAGLPSGLATAGFEIEGFEPSTEPDPGTRSPRACTTARFAPRFVPHRMPTAAVPMARHAVVVGAGLAGAAAAKALAQQGLQVTVLEQLGAPAQQASGNPGGIFHGTLNADDGIYARLFRTAALHAAREYGQATATGLVPGHAGGLLRLETSLPDTTTMQALLARVGLPADYVVALSQEEASQRAGVPLPGPAWFYPGGGWVAPPAWVRQALATPGVQLRCATQAQALVRNGEDWCVHDAQGRMLARAPIVVLANASGAAPLLAPLGHGPWPLQNTRGQVTHWPERSTSPLKLPVAGDGYALPLPGGLLCGATRQNDDEDAAVRDTDHQVNLARLQRLTGLAAPADPALWQGRVGWRLQADDRLPIAGPMPLARMPVGQRMDQARLLPRESGLFVLTALGARGLTLAPLLARLVAAQATGTPWPVEQALADAVDPARWRVRAARVAR